MWKIFGHHYFGHLHSVKLTCLILPFRHVFKQGLGMFFLHVFFFFFFYMFSFFLVILKVQCPTLRRPWVICLEDLEVWHQLSCQVQCRSEYRAPEYRTSINLPDSNIIFIFHGSCSQLEQQSWRIGDWALGYIVSLAQFLINN